jgi:hypothetical protein
MYIHIFVKAALKPLYVDCDGIGKGNTPDEV